MKINIQSIFLSMSMTLAFSSYTFAQKNTQDMLLGVLWAQTSVEFKMAARQAFHTAELNLEQALKDPSWTAALEQKGNFQSLPPAVIIDIDETVLDNSSIGQ